MKGKVSKILLAIAVILMLGSTVTGMVFSIISYNAVKEDKEKQKKEDEEQAAKENDTENVLIGGQYQIASTKHISDAYISGDSSQLSDEDKKTLEVASAILDEIIEDGMNSFEKEEAIYNYICDNIKHDNGGSVAVPEAAGIVDRPFGVLQNKQAVCVGYATSFRLLSNMIGLDCMVMHDTGSSHSWDLVKLEDDCWYIVDCYSDAENFSARYTHFNMNNEYASNNLDWDPTLYPVANGSEYCYLEMNKKILSNPLDLMAEVFDLYSKGQYFGSFEVPNANENSDTVYYISMGITERLMSYDSYCMMDSYVKENGKLMVIYSYTSSEDIEDPDIDNPDIDYNAIDNKLDDLFGEANEDFKNDYYVDNNYDNNEKYEDELNDLRTNCEEITEEETAHQ